MASVAECQRANTIRFTVQKSEWVKLIYLHKEKVTKSVGIIVPFCAQYPLARVLIYWILCAMETCKSKKWRFICEYQKNYFTANRWLKKFGDVADSLDFVKAFISQKSLEDMYGINCLYFGSCVSDMCEFQHRAIYQLLQICGHPAAWFPTSFNKNIFLSSVRKGQETFLFLVDLRQEYIYYSENKFGMWAQPEKLEEKCVLVHLLVNHLKMDTEKGTRDLAPVDNMMVFNWCFSVFDPVYLTGMYNILLGSFKKECIKLHQMEPHFHFALPPIVVIPDEES